MNKQIEITEPTELLDEKGNLLVAGWARHNLFTYDRKYVHPRNRLKEWDFYQISNGEWMVQINFANITIGAAAAVVVKNLKTGELYQATNIEVGTKKKFILPRNGEIQNFFRYDKHGVIMQLDTRRNFRKLNYKGKKKNVKNFDMEFVMHFPENHENITIVTPFKDKPTHWFMTMKQNSMPCEGVVNVNGQQIVFDKSNTFAVLDWGRGVWPYKNEWYWGNGTTYIDGKLFGFELTWIIGDESNATETCLFYDGKAHKIGAVDVDPKPQGHYMDPWHFKSEDGRLDVTMTPFHNHKTGSISLGLGMESNQVHGLWNGYAILDDGTKLEIKDMYAFCEYVQNRW